MRPFLEAIMKGNRTQLNAMLLEDSSLANLKNETGISAVLLSIYYQEPDIAADLVAAGAEIGIFEAAALGDVQHALELIRQEPGRANAYAPDGFQPLGLACFFRHPEMAKLLLDAGAQVNSPSRNAQMVMPLHSAAASHSLEISQALLERGADVNARQEGGYTPLHEAAHSGDLALLELLLQYGANPTVRNDSGQTALDIAAEKGHTEVADRLQIM